MRSIGQHLRLCGLATLLWLFSAQAWPQAGEVTTSTLDERSYRALTLASGLKVLLIQDKSHTDLDWALSVKAGAASDPLAFPGLHRLAAIALQGQLTGEVDFSVTPRYTVFELPTYARQRTLQQALQLLRPSDFSDVDIARAQQLLAERIRSARQVAPHEHRTDVLKAIARTDLPGQSASIAPMVNVGPALRQYMAQHYRADRAALVVRSAASLDRMAEQIKTIFQFAKSTPANPLAGFDALAFETEKLPIEVHVNSLVEAPALYFYFPVAGLNQLERQHTFAIVDALITRQGEGSLVALLQALGWGESITFNTHIKPSGDGFAVVKVGLTSLGVRASPQIEALLFYVLRNIQQRGLDEWRFTELARAANNHFLYRDAFAERSLPVLANRLQDTEPAKVLVAPYELGVFNESVVRDALKSLSSESVIVMLVSDTVQGANIAGQSHTAYRLMEAEVRQPDIKPEVKRRLHFPDANRFIPQKLIAKSSQLLLGPQNNQNAVPFTLVNKSTITAWYQGGAQSGLPDASLYLRLLTQGGGATAKQAVDTLLASYLLADRLKAQFDEAERAGVSYIIRPTVLGLDIEVSGYNSQLGLVISRLAEALDQPMASGKPLNRAHRWLEMQLTSPGEVGEAFTDPFILWQYEPYWSAEQLLQAFEGVSLDSWRHSVDVQSLQMLVAGSLYQQEAKRLAALAELRLLADEATGILPARLILAKGGRPQGLERREEQLTLYLQSGSSRARDFVFLRTIARLLDGELINVEGGDHGPGLSEGTPVAIRAELSTTAGMAGLTLTTSADVLTGPLLEALKRRLAGPDIAHRLAELKRVWRQEEIDVAQSRAASSAIWQNLTQPLPDDNRAALAALNTASVERYVENLFTAEIRLMTSNASGLVQYRQQFDSSPIGFRLPKMFPPLWLD
ncbi:insulinase family protein [Gilvimarinus agarilyticus]|uniref:insulinase family protein n=1 Tax=Gilvimarinus sp. 2_MG-2023 TaxID=3062666 RepID=UPI001C0A30D2|nr:insulinase family protein [Gilvimarinus sp. 2_MG-2023]MBU2887337.1 insulinase family protein [Gilvimarinus agarilyticus]MDO6571996.1 insulinase family protein [Gilvimarinus sp. 2_MG-2023]